MKTIKRLQKSWKLSLVNSLVLSGTITLTSCLTIASSGNYAWSQITSDGTVGSQVSSPIPGTFLIDGGATRGSNLFHSFSEFSVPSKGIADFKNLTPIQNIITRVTGGSISNIDGLIRAKGTANLFFLNPNGIIFGPNAQLQIGGSFLASTANSLNFADGTKFSATASQTTPLLTVSAPLGLQYGSNIGNIQVQGSVLQVNNGQSLALVGGSVQLNNAVLEAPGGRVELGGLSQPGTVKLNVDGNKLRLSFPSDVARADVSLINEADVNVLASGSGSIAINAQNLNITGESRLLAGVGSGLGSLGSIPGDIEIQVKEAINLTEGTIANVVLEGGRGQGGDIKITTGQLFVLGGSGIVANTDGTANGGNLSINASEKVQVIGTTPDGRLFSRLSALTLGTAKAGSMEITTKQLLISDGAQIGVGTTSSGNGGNLMINASEGVQVIGTTPNGKFRSTLLTQTESTGAAGKLEITTKQLLISDGGVVSSSSLGDGNAGNLIVNASEKVQLIGTTPDGKLSTGLFASTKDIGAAGNLEIWTQQLIVQGGAQVGTGTFGLGNAGNLIVNASDSVQLIGTAPNGLFSSGLFARTEGTGDAGNLEIITRQLLISNGAQASVSTFGSRNGGKLIVNASDSVQLIGTTPNGLGASGLLARTEGTGDAGNLEIITRQLLISDGAQVSVSTIGSGNGGNLIVKASEKAQLIGTSVDGKLPSGLLAKTSSNSTGNGGSISLSINNLDLSNGAEISTQSEGSGKAGNLEVRANSIHLDNRGQITAETASGQGGNINLKVQDVLLMRQGSRISTTAGTAKAGGDGGNIGIDSLFIVAVPKENSDITANAYTGRGGNINITTQGIYGLEFRPRLTPFSDITASSEFGVNGNVQINTSGIDPSRGLNNLPVEPVTLEVTEGCQGEGKPGTVAFFNTGKGGLAPNPYEPKSSSNIWEDVPLSTPGTANSTSPPQTIIEAQSWIVNEKGEVVLVAEIPVTRSQGRCRLR
ncbi:MAG: filamentous hemagglutinin N-terminal domain-containing protein [Potamolinea sp.]